jgi:hypothetical protein
MGGLNMNDILKNEAHTWKVGDLCKCEYNGTGAGIVYRVVEVTKLAGCSALQLKIEPVLGVIAEAKGKKTRGLAAGWCMPLSLEDLKNTYASFGHFILTELTRT